MFARERRSRSPLQWVRLLCAAVLLAGSVLGGVSSAQESARKVIAKTAPGYPELAKIGALRKAAGEALPGSSGPTSAWHT